MIPSSMRRIATGTPQASSALLSSIAPTGARASPAVAFAYNPRCQQRRRYSSSKPSSPNDSPKNVPDGQVAAAPSTTKRGGRRKAKDSLLAAQQANLPSVPSTHHVPHEGMSIGCQENITSDPLTSPYSARPVHILLPPPTDVGDT